MISRKIIFASVVIIIIAVIAFIIYKFTTKESGDGDDDDGASTYPQCMMNSKQVPSEWTESFYDDMVQAARGRKQTGKGTVSATKDSTIVTGDGTSFSKTFKIGQVLEINGVRPCKEIASINSDTELTVSNPFEQNVAGNTYIVPGKRFCQACVTNGLANRVSNPLKYCIAATAAQDKSKGPGTVRVDADDLTKVTGTGTSFTSTFKVGHVLDIPGRQDCRVISRIASDTELTVRPEFTRSVDGSKYNVGCTTPAICGCVQAECGDLKQCVGTPFPCTTHFTQQLCEDQSCNWDEQNSVCTGNAPRACNDILEDDDCSYLQRIHNPVFAPCSLDPFFFEPPV